MAENKVSRKHFNIPHFRLLGLLMLATGVSWAAWFLVLKKLDPYASPSLALPLFFLSTLLALTGTFTLILFALKRWKVGDHIYIKHILISIRQGLLLSLCTCLALSLLMLGLLRVWNGLLIVILTMLIEFYFSRKDDLN